MSNTSTRNGWSAVTRMTAIALFTLLTGLSTFGQNKMENGDIPVGVPGGEKDPSVTLTQNHTNPTPPALWSVQFNHDVTTGGAGVGHAAVAFIGHEFWASKWQSDTITRFSPTGAYRGSFTISGVSGCRAMTFDGTSIYMSNNTATIYRIDTTSKSVVGVINAPITQVRMLSYDPTANSNAGGFYIGNFNTDITLINMTGGVLNTIAAGTHGLGGMYGCAWENQTTGGPYLWVFHQGGASSQAEIARLQLPLGTPTLATHDVMSDIGAGLASGLAGGLFISDGLVSGQYTIVGMLQGSPTNQLFGYELNDFVQPAVDAEMETAKTSDGYTMVPIAHATSVNVEGTIRNAGSSSLGSVSLNVHIYNGASQVFTDVQAASNLAPGASTTLTSAGFAPSGVGTYTVHAFSTVGGAQTDPITSNDSVTFSFEITDTTFARDNGVSTGTGYTVSATDWAYAVSLFETQVADTLSSVWIQLEVPVDGDTTYAVIAAAPSGSPNALIATGTVNLISSSQNTYVLTFPGGVALTPGMYAIGCYEGANTGISLSQSNNIFTPSTNFFYLGSAGTWNTSNIQTARFIRPNFGTPVMVANDQVVAKQVAVYPNPSNGQLFVELKGYSEGADLQVVNGIGQVVYSSRIEAGISRTEIGMVNQPSGIYFVKVSQGEDHVMKKIILTH